MMKFFNLVLYSRSPIYDKMKEALDKYYSTFDNVITLYYTCDPNIDDMYKLDKNILYIKEEDTFIPGILKKTVKAFDYVYNNYNLDDITYIIRSNISTIINFNELKNELYRNPINIYGGGHVINLHWIDNNSGIVDNRWFNTQFASGTSIILQKEGMKFIIDNKDKLNYTIIDDVSIAILFRQYMELNANRINIFKFLFVPLFIYNDKIDKNILNNIINEKFIFYRNRCINDENRQIDIIQMNAIIDTLLNH